MLLSNPPDWDNNAKTVIQKMNCKNLSTCDWLYVQFSITSPRRPQQSFSKVNIIGK